VRSLPVFASLSEYVEHASESVTDSVFFMRADDENIVNSTALGRNSIRITSQESWNDALYVLDVLHMPEGCSTWPAFWTKSATSLWPAGGEIDIIEGIFISSIVYLLDH
jgi:hypothetical protein